MHRMDKGHKSAVQMIESDSKLSEYNRKTVLKACYDLQTEGISTTRQVKYLRIRAPIAKMLKKDFESHDRRQKTSSESSKQSHFADWTKSDYKVTLKRFYA